MTVVEKTPAAGISQPTSWIPSVHYVLAVAAGLLAAFHSTFHLTPLIQAVVLIVAAVLVVVGTLVHFLERKASLSSMAAYLRSVVPDVLAVLDEAKGEAPSIAARIGQVESDVAAVTPAVTAISALLPGQAAAQGATTFNPLPVTVVQTVQQEPVGVTPPLVAPSVVVQPPVAPPGRTGARSSSTATTDGLGYWMVAPPAPAPAPEPAPAVAAPVDVPVPPAA